MAYSPRVVADERAAALREPRPQQRGRLAGACCAGEERITFSAETPWVRDDLLAAATARAVYFADWKSRLPDPVEI